MCSADNGMLRSHKKNAALTHAVHGQTLKTLCSVKEARQNTQDSAGVKFLEKANPQTHRKQSGCPEIERHYKQAGSLWGMKMPKNWIVVMVAQLYKQTKKT